MLSVVLPPSVPFVAGAAVDDDDDDDWSGIDVETEDDGDSGESDFDSASQEEGDTTLAELVDANLSHTEQKVRMTLCIGLARQRYATDMDHLKEAVSQMAESAGITEDQAVNQLHVNMIKNCYLNLDQANDLKELTSGDVEKFNEISARVVGPPEEEGDKPSTLLPRQWELIREVVEAEQNKSDDGDNDEPYKEFANMGRMELIGSKMSGFQKFLYFVSVFGAVFGGGYLLVKRLIAYELEKNTKRVSKKAAKKDN